MRVDAWHIRGGNVRELARLCTIAVLSCCGAVILVNTLASGHASCRSLSGVSKVEFKARVFRLNKLSLCILRLSMHYLLVNFNIPFVPLLHGKPLSLRIATYWCM